AMGGFSGGEAEGFRRAMGRRDWHLHEEEYHAKFLRGARERDVTDDVAEQVYSMLIGFAEFGFPKSHSTAFGLLAYQSTWLKEYFPAEFYCALYNQWPMGFYPPHVVTNDAKRHSVNVLTPSVNQSQTLCTVENGAVRIGLHYVTGFGKRFADNVVTERTQHGAFTSLFDYVQRTHTPRALTEQLITTGAFDQFGLNHRELLWQL